MIYIVAGNLTKQADQKVKELLAEDAFRKLITITSADQFMNADPVALADAKHTAILIRDAENYLDCHKSASRLNRLVTFKLTDLGNHGACIILVTAGDPSWIDKRIRNQAIAYQYDYINYRLSSAFP